MIFNVTPKYRILSDLNSWMIQKRITRCQDEAWMSIKWYTSLEGAINGLAQMLIRSSEAESLLDALEDVKSVTAQLSLAFAPMYVLDRGRD